MLHDELILALVLAIAPIRRAFMFNILIFLAIIAVIALWGTGIYNTLVRLRNAYKNAFAQIDVQLQRRFDLIPNLVEVAKKYMAHERETLEAVITARAAAQSGLAAAKANPGDPESMAELAAAQGQLGSVLGRLLMVAEAYPELKANQTMMQLTEELSSTENRVAFARQAFNDAVMSYNNQREVFPSTIFAGMFGFQAASLLEIPADKQAQVREAPKVSF
jgi:LemA protein